MRNTWYVAQRELTAIFVQPIAYVFTIVLVGITGYIFAAQITTIALNPGAPVTLANVLSLFTFLFIFAGPAITMRLLSEEQRSGTMELLMTLPLRDGEVVVGKFLASFIFYLAVVSLTLIFPVILLNFGNPDLGPMITGYLGVLLWGSAILAIGLLASAMTDNQMVAFILALGFNLLLYLAFIPAEFFGNNPAIALIFQELGAQQRLGSFFRGVLVAKDIVYFVMITAVCLFAATRVIESRRWRG